MALLGLSQSADAQVTSAITESGCVSISGQSSTISVSGILTTEIFPGPPNFADVKKGDLAEHAYVLQLPQPVCLDDGGDFADPALRFDVVQISADRKEILASLSRVIGKHVTIKGSAVAAQTGHHHAPLVVVATSVIRDR